MCSKSKLLQVPSVNIFFWDLFAVPLPFTPLFPSTIII